MNTQVGNFEAPDKLAAPIRQEYGTKLALIILFLALFAGFVAWKGPRLGETHLSALDLALLALATLRMGRLAAYDRIMEPLRYPFTVTRPDTTGAGDSVEPRGKGVRQAFGQLISCPICAGTWFAAGLVFGLYAFPGPARVFLTILAAVGAAELLHTLGEALSWQAQCGRAQAGAYARRQARRPAHIPLEADRKARSGAESRPNGGAAPVAPGKQ